VELVGVRLLVVDDDAEARELLDATLRQYRAAVATASSVREALGALEAATCDVLLSDLAMPGEDGYDLIQAVRRHADSDVRQVAAIAVTAHADEAHKARALAGGFDDVVTKPIDADRLIRAIERALARKAGKGATAR
jgi:CheY-like chemotaxis protein